MAIFTLAWHPSADADVTQVDIDALTKKPGFDIAIPRVQCEKIFPFHKVIPRKLPNGSSFELFAFSAELFDPRKPTILATSGGPGKLPSREDIDHYVQRYPGVNVISYHVRGAGCSSFYNPDLSLNAFISTPLVIDDLEIIRNAFGISHWASIIGSSSDSLTAKAYAHRHPNAIRTLVLEGLADRFRPSELPEEELTARYLKTLRERYDKSSVLQGAIKPRSYENFVYFLNTHFEQYPLSGYKYILLFWEQFQQQINGAYEDGDRPAFLNLDSFLSTFIVEALGEENETDYFILKMLESFGYLRIDATLEAEISTKIAKFDKMIFPIRHPDFLEFFNLSGLISERVNNAMITNDARLAEDDLCTKIDTLIIGGTQDLLTPVDAVEKYLNQRKCASGQNISLIVEGGGHRSGNMQCLEKSIMSFIRNGDVGLDLAHCEMPVHSKKYADSRP